jgi:glucosylceramidase
MALVVAVAVSSVADASLCVVTTESLSQRFAACSVAFKSTAESDGATDLKTGNLGSGNWRLSVDDSNAGGRQRISGFGAAWTDATVAVFDSLSAERQATLLEQLFGESGIGLSVMRHTIGQSDLTPPALGRWSFDENGGEPDPTLQQFNLTAPGERMLSWLRRMRAASSRRVLLLGSPWSPPAWMKQDNTLQWQYVDAWVQYMLTYLRTYRKAGVAVDAITPQNEPLHSADGAWTMRLDASYQ